MSYKICAGVKGLAVEIKGTIKIVGVRTKIKKKVRRRAPTEKRAAVGGPSRLSVPSN